MLTKDRKFNLRANLFFLLPKVLFPVLSALYPLAAGELPESYDPEGEVGVLSDILALHPEQYQLLAAETFEKERLWKVYNPSTALNVIRFVKTVPDEPAAFKENEMIRRYYPSHEQKYSLHVHTSFEIPGRQQFRMIPSEEIILSERIFRLSLWVHSLSYSHRLGVIFADSKGKEIKVDLGRLDFTGWKRISKDLPFQLNSGRHGTQKFRLRAVVIDSAPGEKPGDVSVMLDSLLVVAGRKNNAFPSEPW